MKIIQEILLIIIYLILSKNIFSQVNEEWISIYDGPPSKTSTSKELKINNNKDLYVLGTNSNDIVLLKYNLRGEVVWIAKYNGPGNGNDLPNEFLFDKSGNIYVTGKSDGIGSGDDYITIKFDTLGNQIWAVRYSSFGTNYDAAYSISIDSSENIFVTGQSYNNSTSAIDCITIKYDSFGNQQWVSRFQAGLRCIGYRVRTDKWGNCFVTGHGNVGIFTIKYNCDGEQLWNVAYSATGSESPNNLEIDSSGNVYVAGVSNLGSYWDYITIKYDSSGNEMWNRRYNGSANYMDQVTDMKIDKYGNIYVTGGSDGNGTHFDYATVKYDSSGNQKWVIRYNYSNEYDDETSGISVDTQNNVYVTGNSYIWGRYTVATIKYSQTLTGIYPLLLENPSEYSLKQNYPNPFNPKTIINYKCSMFNYVSLKVYDVLGNEIATLVNENKSAGSYEVEFDGSNYASAIYFYRLEVDGIHIDTKRMILLK